MPILSCMLSIENDGQAILRSNYWDTPLNESGTIAISMNAGAFRILLPDSMVDQVAEMLTAREVIVSKGHYQARRAYEILFDDHTDSPYSLMVDGRQFASLQPEDREHGKEVRVSVWVRGPERVLEMPARFRVVRRLPCLQPWGK